jgi:hypothetical protein
MVVRVGESVAFCCLIYISYVSRDHNYREISSFD